MEKIPLFSTHYSLGRSILTVEKYGKSKKTGADSVVDLIKDNQLKEAYIVDENIAGFPELYENFKEVNIPLRYGIKIICCNDITDKSEESLNTNSKIIIFCLNTQGYYDLLPIWSRAATEGKYYVPRIDWKGLKELWTKNLALCIPFYDSFLFVNNLENGRAMPDFPAEPIFFIENNELPFDDLMNQIVKDFCKDKYKIQAAQSIFYNKKSDVKAFQVFRCLNKRSTLSHPKLNQFCSNTFCFENYLNESTKK